jgi:hypothetical protein
MRNALADREEFMSVIEGCTALFDFLRTPLNLLDMLVSFFGPGGGRGETKGRSK